MLVVRGNYSYSIELSNDTRGVTAKMFSKGGEEFNQNDEIIFMDFNQIRKSYRFMEMGELSQDAGKPVHSNSLQLDLAAIEWLSGNDITTIYIKNNVSNQMREVYRK